MARVKTGVHRKLLFGFLAGALLLVAMAILSLVVIRQMNDRMAELESRPGEVRASAGDAVRGDGAKPLPGDGTAPPDDAAKYNGQVEDEKAKFARLLDLMEQDEPANAAFYEGVRSDNEKYRQSGQQVLALFEQGAWRGHDLHLE